MRNVFGRSLRASLLAECDCYREELGDRLVVPALASLAMGDRNACDYAQASHRELLIKAGALDPSCEVRYGSPLPRSPTLHGVLIDDRLSLSIIANGAAGIQAAARASREWDAAMDAYASSCGRPVAAKSQRRARAGRVWGSWLNGKRGSIGGPPDRRAALGVVSLRMARCRYSTAKLLEQLLGTYVFHLLFRRAAFAVPDSSFRFARNDSAPYRVTRLPADVRCGQRLLGWLCSGPCL